MIKKGEFRVVNDMVNNKVLAYSYALQIGLYNPDTSQLYINPDALGYSVTTSKHVNMFRRMFPHATVINNKSFKEL